jgi:hypothetical protein
MIERAKRTKKQPKATTERITMLDDRLLHMTREEAKAYLDAYLQERGLATGDGTVEPGSPGVSKRPGRRPSGRRAQA